MERSDLEALISHIWGPVTITGRACYCAAAFSSPRSYLSIASAATRSCERGVNFYATWPRALWSLHRGTILGAVFLIRDFSGDETARLAESAR